MSKEYAIAATLRENKGKSANKKLRDQGLIPAVIYGNKKDNHSIAIDSNEITKRIKQGRFYTQLCEITIGNKKLRAIPKVLSFHPVTDKIEHIDFYEVSEKEKVKIQVYIKLLNEVLCAGVKKGGVINVAARRVELLCYPKDIFSEIELDLIDLQIGESLHFSDLKLPEGVELAIKSYNPTVATIVGRAAEEETPTGLEAGEEGADAAEADASSDSEDSKE